RASQHPFVVELVVAPTVRLHAHRRHNHARFAFFAAAMALALALRMLSVRAADPPTDKPEYGTGRTQTPEIKGEKQPQRWTGPTTTGAGGAPASSHAGPIAARHAGCTRGIFQNDRRTKHRHSRRV